VLFSEPKIPQFAFNPTATTRTGGFQCSSASRKFLNRLRLRVYNKTAQRFQCSSASRKFLNKTDLFESYSVARVSVLFSEPKIPQCRRRQCRHRRRPRFSALQRAENSSISEQRKCDLHE